MNLQLPRTATNQTMQPEDVPGVAALFQRAFRDGTPPSAELCDYFAASFFSSPMYDPDLGSRVHRAADGTIDSALLVIPMQVRIGTRVLTGRLMSNYMTDPARRTRGGAELVLTIRARNQEFCFSDSANPVSTAHWKAVGGKVLAINSLDWRRVLRPATWLTQRLSPRLPKPLRPVLRALASLADRALRLAQPALIAEPTLGGTPMTDTEFTAFAPTCLERFALAPVWSAPELAWLLAMARRNTIDGPLILRQVRNAKDAVIGCSVIYAQKGGTARVLNILSLPGHAAAVIADVLHHADQLGCAAVQGMAQPCLMETLGQFWGMGFVPRGSYCISTRHPEIVEAAERGDVYLGGLAGEDWSRLVTDFHD